MDELAFSAQEFEDRHRRIRGDMKERSIDALIVTRGENIFYGSGYKAAHFASWLCELHALVMPAVGSPRIMTRSLEREATKIQYTEAPRLYMDHEDPYGVVFDILKESGNTAGTLGIEERYLKLSQFKRLQKVLPDATFVDVSGMIEAVAASPSAAESECLRRASRITSIGLDTGLNAAKAGVYPYEVIGKVHQAMYAAGQRDFDMALVAVWSGPQGGRMHDTSTTEKIKDGDIVTVEIMGVDNHYRAGAQACIYVGREPPKAVADAYRLVTDMHDKAKRAVKAGITAGDVFDAASSVYRAAKGTDYYRRCGGSMGLTIFTLDLVKGRKNVLNPGVALLVQTLVDDPVLLTCASTVMVTETGCEELTQPVLGMKAGA
ncbi:MAG: M24 family metallopeptidase [Xanthobacteraceae bacterium]